MFQNMNTVKRRQSSKIPTPQQLPPLRIKTRPTKVTTAKNKNVNNNNNETTTTPTVIPETQNVLSTSTSSQSEPIQKLSKAIEHSIQILASKKPIVRENLNHHTPPEK